MGEVRNEIDRILDQQDAKGIRKYGGTLDVTQPETGELIQHAIEECTDMLQYLVALKLRLEKLENGKGQDNG